VAGESPFTMPSMNPFLAFWNDFYSKMVAAGLTPGQAPQDMAERMRRSFFDAMAKYADEFMRSEAFLTAMKQSFDNALAMQSAMNQYLQKGLATAQMPSRIDQEQLVAMVRGMEDRLFTRLDALASRIEKLEKSLDKTGDKPARSKSAH
jgi:hypothetical protein